jgi:aminoglycoside phosphotransferase (APT) family kinase protein
MCQAPAFQTPVAPSIHHSDIRLDNFLLDPATQLVLLIDFEYIGVFSLSFRAFVLWNTDNVFTAAVGTWLGVERGESEMRDAAEYCACCEFAVRV